MNDFIGALFSNVDILVLDSYLEKGIGLPLTDRAFVAVNKERLGAGEEREIDRYI